MTTSEETKLWDAVKEKTKVAQEKGTDPFLWAMQVSSSLSSKGMSLPSLELAKFLVSYICWDNNVPILWKFLENALVFKIVPPLLVLALLSHRVIPCRHSQPAAYRLFMELLKRHALELKYQLHEPIQEQVMISIDAVLHLSENFGLQAEDTGTLVVEFIFSIVWRLLDASLEDEGLLELTLESQARWGMKPQEMEIDTYDEHNEKRIEHHKKLQNMNTIIAIEIIGIFWQNRLTSRLLYLARKNLPAHWTRFIQRIRILGTSSSALRNSKILTPNDLLQLASDTRALLTRESKTSSLQKFHAKMALGSLTSAHGATPSALWLPLDLALEDAIDGFEASSVSAVETVTSKLRGCSKSSGLTKTLQAINGTTWRDTFLGLWIAGLRLVQRERDPIEGPHPHLDTRLCVLLSIIPLVVADICEEEETSPINELECSSTNHWKEKNMSGKCRNDLVSSLQLLSDHQSLLSPPQCVVSVANQAAAKALLLVSGVNIGSVYLESLSMKDLPMNCCKYLLHQWPSSSLLSFPSLSVSYASQSFSCPMLSFPMKLRGFQNAYCVPLSSAGNLWHLIVEACIARNLLDTSAYFWSGYVKGCINQIPQSLRTQVPGWSSFMKGAPLTHAMINALVSVPASSLAELEKIFELAVKGSDDDKISAATILCGASLLRGWNIQEHITHFIAKLLSPPIPADYSGVDSHLICYAPILNVLIAGIGTVDSVQIFSMHGLAPQLACSLMPICEVFGSCVPDVSWALPSGEAITANSVFSNAFVLLLRLWRFNKLPFDHGVGDVPTVGSQLTPEYLLSVRNSHLVSSESSNLKNRNKRRLNEVATSSSPQPVFVDSFPKLRVWYRRHQECIASTTSGLVQGATVHHIVNVLLNMMFRKMNWGNQSLTSTSGSSSSSGPGNEDSTVRPKLPAWDMLEAVPFVLDTALTACAHGRLTPRELATGLKDLADFLPASLATIVSYFSAEVSRGVWKPVPMNGTDWPSPAAILSVVEEKIKKILAVTGVSVPSLAAGGSSPATLPLPLAAFVSLTITYKIDKASERFLNLLGPALVSLAAGCPWPCMPIVTSLWAQKAKRWFDFLIFSASSTVFLNNSDSVFQLFRSCFSTTIGLNDAALSSNGGVGALLGHGFGSHFVGGISPVAPGFVYLRARRTIRDIVFIGGEIICLMMHSVGEIASTRLPEERLDKLKRTKNGLRHGQVSLASAMARVKLAASLGASLVWLSGGLVLVQSLFKETLPSWFIAVHRSEQEEGPGGTHALLRGNALAYFAVLSGAFAWGIDSSSSASKRRPKILGSHMEFMASTLDGKISLGCDWPTWRSYVSCFVSLMVCCMPSWVLEVNSDVLKRLSKGLRQWNEEELALALLGIGGVGTMGAAAELIVEDQ